MIEDFIVVKPLLIVPLIQMFQKMLYSILEEVSLIKDINMIK